MTCKSRLAVLLALVFFPSAVQASKPPAGPALTARWLGVAGVSVTDGEATLLFDPVFTKPGLDNWLWGAKFVTDPVRVRNGLAAADIRSAEAVFISHTHFDHAVDAAAVAQMTGAAVYGGPSLRRVVERSGLPVHFELVSDHQPIQIGKFRVTVIHRFHPPVIQRFGWSFLGGTVPADFDFSFYQYREGEVWCFFVEHPSGNLLIDQGSQFYPPNVIYKKRVNTYFMGVANKRSIEDLLYGNIDRIQPKRVVPLHFDAFFLQAQWLEKLRFLGGTLDEIKARLSREAGPHPEFLIPHLNQPIPIP